MCKLLHVLSLEVLKQLVESLMCWKLLLPFCSTGSDFLSDRDAAQTPADYLVGGPYAAPVWLVLPSLFFRDGGLRCAPEQ